ncbi:hypothetical protein Bbelb_151570 [Branchiostoma belcheri]|nr:hypothetical protein Bbelb_151570 [Branchiostoma belcheri]
MARLHDGRVETSSYKLCSEGLQPVQVFSTDAMRLVMTEAAGDQIREYWASSEDSCLNLTRLDWTRPDDLETQEKYQRRLDQTRPGDLKTPDEYPMTLWMIRRPDYSRMKDQTFVSRAQPV